MSQTIYVDALPDSLADLELHLVPTDHPLFDTIDAPTEGERILNILRGYPCRREPANCFTDCSGFHGGLHGLNGQRVVTKQELKKYQTQLTKGGSL